MKRFVLMLYVGVFIASGSMFHDVAQDIAEEHPAPAARIAPSAAGDQWMATYGGLSDDSLLSVAQTHDGGFVAGDFRLNDVGGPPGPAALSIRPQDMTLAPPGSGIRAKVAECEFLGSHTRYRVQLSGHAHVQDRT